MLCVCPYTIFHSLTATAVTNLISFRYSNDCEDVCVCNWDQGFETCAECTGAQCFSCVSGYTLSDGQCYASDAFTADEQIEDEENENAYHFWLGVFVGSVMSATLMGCVLLVVFVLRRKSKAKVAAGGDDIKLREDQQLQTVGNTMIELRESFEVNEPGNIEQDVAYGVQSMSRSTAYSK